MGRNSQREREEQKHAYKKAKRKKEKTDLTLTGLLMEGLAYQARCARVTRHCPHSAWLTIRLEPPLENQKLAVLTEDYADGRGLATEGG